MFIKKINLIDIIAEEKEERHRTTSTHAILFEENGNVSIVGNKERIAQVIDNLLSNAIKYSDNNKKIIVRLIKKHNVAMCSVEDFGIGIPEVQQDKIFQKFTGLPAKPESEEGKDSTFYFSLPVAD